MTLQEDYDAIKAQTPYWEEVAATLGDGWTFQPTMYESTHHVGRLVHSDGMHLGLYLVAYGHAKGRVEIRGEYAGIRLYGNIPYEMLQHLEYPSITVAPTRRADVVAGDIVKRLLPKYHPIFVKVLEDVNRTARYLSDGLIVSGSIAKAIGGEVRHDGKGTYTIRVYGGDIWGDVTVNGTKCSVNLHKLSGETVIGLLAAIGITPGTARGGK